MKAGAHRPSPPGWLVLLAVGATLVSAVEAALLSIGTGFFGGGFNSIALDAGWQVPAFFVVSVALDAGSLLVLWTLLHPILRFSGLSGARAWWWMLVVGVGMPCLHAAYRYNFYAIAGDMLSLTIVAHAPLSSSSSVARELASGGDAIWLALGTLTALGVGLVSNRLKIWERSHPQREQSYPPPPATRAVLMGATMTLTITLASHVPGPTAERIRYGLSHKTSHISALALLSKISDLDGDGFGPLTTMADPAPLDATIHPHAREIPGNGIDENGIGGDLAIDYRSEGPVRAPLPGPGPRPHVLLLYLESFRHDLLGSHVNGRAVTPFLDLLAAEGASSSHAWAHTPWTLDSRAQLFTGLVSYGGGGSTLIDDFGALGYEVLYFSGQDESYGRSEVVLGVGRAHHFYDARQDEARRSSRSTAPVSLQVSWKVVEQRVRERLALYDGERPLFLYANLTDTHFPYSHHEIDDILGVEPLDRSKIRASRAPEVRRAYANTAANVDRGCERITGLFRDAIGGDDHAVLVLADHGEAFYERGRLGHGHSLTESETRIPFIVWGIGGEWPEPIAPSDVRGLIRLNLSVDREAGRPRARFVAMPSRRLLQYAPALKRPRMIGLRGLDGLEIYDFERDELRFEKDEEPELPAVAAAPPRDELIWRWEAARNQGQGPQ